MTLALPSTHDSCHWYHRDGTRCSEVIGKTTGTPRKPTIRDARELGLLPGVTGICKLFPNDSLQRWKRGQDILAAITTPRNQYETDEFYISRILAAADEECCGAADIGTRRHKQVEDFHLGMPSAYLPDDDYAFIKPYMDWHAANVERVTLAETITLSLDHGYAGTMDLLCVLKDKRVAVVDLKNRKNLATYETDGMQLAAYRRAIGAEIGVSVVLGTEQPEILVKEWTQAEDEHAWGNFEVCLTLWKRSNNYWPEQWKPLMEDV